MDEASSAREAATVRTKRQGMSHPNTMPTCPPDTNGKEKVDETEETTPMIENEKAISSVILDIQVVRDITEDKCNILKIPA
jgi:hypothetical protein